MQSSVAKVLFVAWVLAGSGSYAGADDSQKSEMSRSNPALGAPIWPPASPVIESLAERHDPYFSSRPSMQAFPAWMFPLGVLSTPGLLVPESRSGVSSMVASGKGTTRSPALFAELSNVWEEGALAVEHGRLVFKDRAFIGATVGVHRTSLKKRGKSDAFSSTVTELNDVPSARLSLAGRLYPGVWIGLGREWQRHFGKTINEVSVASNSGSNVTTERRDTGLQFVGAELQLRSIHVGLELTMDNDERQPSRTYSLPMRFGLGEQFWFGVRGLRTQREDRLNSETLDSREYEGSLGRQFQNFGFGLGVSRQAGAYKSSSGSGSLDASAVFCQLGWGYMRGGRIHGRVSLRNRQSKTSTSIVDKVVVASVNLGFSFVN